MAESNSKLPNSSSKECGMGDHNASQGGVSGIRGVNYYGKEYRGGGLISYSGGVAYSEMSSPSVSVIVSPDKRGVTDTVHETQRTHTHISRCRRRNVNTAKPFYNQLPPPSASNPTDTQRRPNCQTPGGCWDFLVTPSSLSTS